MLQHPKIDVIGSLNVDHTLRVPHIPAPGGTITAAAAGVPVILILSTVTSGLIRARVTVDTHTSGNAMPARAVPVFGAPCCHSVQHAVKAAEKRQA
jgi:hypothetical protein